MLAALTHPSHIVIYALLPSRYILNSCTTDVSCEAPSVKTANLSLGSLTPLSKKVQYVFISYGYTTASCRFNLAFVISHSDYYFQ
ncbi:hypothetical protein C5468_02190 [Photorhabdus luminescens subsp. mexicana]|uniref:Uncharacterized protein n=1 Tax=Photorhabdus luminescens subsp. mexicana TaxID=2100167 RepID=A0A4R4JNG1_PHOLU|nr:hypothetical protein C5468_02190 [Photorhabdus luminescens subsp. mexicana]